MRESENPQALRPPTTPPQVKAPPFEKPEKTAIAPVALRDEQGRFIEGNPGGPGRPAGRRDRINAALQALADHYKTATQEDAIRAFVLEIVEGFDGNAERLEFLRIIMPKESSADVRLETHQLQDLSPEERAAEEDALLGIAKAIEERRAAGA